MPIQLHLNVSYVFHVYSSTLVFQYNSSTNQPYSMAHMSHVIDINEIPSSFTITCWNCRGLLACGSSIQLYLYDHRPSILIIIEPLLSKKSHPDFPSSLIITLSWSNTHLSSTMVGLSYTSTIALHTHSTSPLTSLPLLPPLLQCSI